MRPLSIQSREPVLPFNFVCLKAFLTLAHPAFTPASRQLLALTRPPSALCLQPFAFNRSPSVKDSNLSSSLKTDFASFFGRGGKTNHHGIDNGTTPRGFFDGGRARTPSNLDCFTTRSNDKQTTGCNVSTRAKIHTIHTVRVEENTS